MNKYYKKLMDHFNKTSDAETSFLIDKNIAFDSLNHRTNTN